MADLVVRATLRDNVLPQLAKIAAGMKAYEEQMKAQSERSQRQHKQTQDEIFKIDNAMRNSARRMIGRAVLIGAALAAAAGHAVALTAALWPMIGALGAIPAVSVAGIAGIAALIVGFSGLGAAMKKTGGGAGSSASQIANAQRRIETANRSLRDSQDELNNAWERARDNLRDIQTDYADAQLGVEAAALAVKRAEEAVKRARSSGDRLDRAEAELALRQARLNQIQVANRLSDVEQEYQDRMARGVDGSEEVRDATERQADAMYELADAQKALADAQKGGGGASAQAEAYAKLSLAGKALVDTFHALGPAWRQVQQATQQALLAGVADDVKKLSTAYLPVMLRQLPAIAQGWNNMLRAITAVSSSDGFVRDMDDSLGLMAIMWQRVGTAFGSFFSGFRHWVRVGSDFMPRLGAWVERQAMRFDLWSARVRETGQAFRWIDNALVVGHKFNELMKSWGRSLFEVFRLGQDKTLLDNLVAGSIAFERWVKAAEGQERITQMWARLRDLGSAAWRVIKEAIDIFSQLDVSAVTVALEVMADVLGLVADNMGPVNAILGPLVLAMVGLKVATMAGALATKGMTAASRLFTAQLAAETAAMKVNTFAKTQNAASGNRVASVMGRIENALGPLALGYIALDAAGDLFLDKWLGIDRNIEGFRKSMDGLGGSTLATAEAYRVAGENLQDYDDQLRAGVDPAFAFMRAQDQVASAQQRVNDAVRDYGDGSPQHIQAVRDLQYAMLDLNSAAVDAAKVNQNELIPQLQALESQAGLAAGTAQGVANALSNASYWAKQMENVRIRFFVEQYLATGGNPNNLNWRLIGSQVLPGVPVMHDGGVVPGRRGEEVAAVLQAGEGVVDLDTMSRMQGGAGGASGGGATTLRFELAGPAEVRALLKMLIRKIVAVDGHGNVQAAFG